MLTGQNFCVYVQRIFILDYFSKHSVYADIYVAYIFLLLD